MEMANYFIFYTEKVRKEKLENILNKELNNQIKEND